MDRHIGGWKKERKTVRRKEIDRQIDERTDRQVDCQKERYTGG